jgi:hypothetical protein
MPWKRYSEGSAIQKSLLSFRESASGHRVGMILPDVFPLKMAVNLRPSQPLSLLSLSMICLIKKGGAKTRTCDFPDRFVLARGKLNCVQKNLGPVRFEAIHVGF